MTLETVVNTILVYDPCHCKLAVINPPDRTFSQKVPNYQILVKKTSFIRNNHIEKNSTLILFYLAICT